MELTVLSYLAWIALISLSVFITFFIIWMTYKKSVYSRIASWSLLLFVFSFSSALTLHDTKKYILSFVVGLIPTSLGCISLYLARHPISHDPF